MLIKALKLVDNRLMALKGWELPKMFVLVDAFDDNNYRTIIISGKRSK